MISWGNLANQLEQWASSRYALLEGPTNYFIAQLLQFDNAFDTYFANSRKIDGDLNVKPSDLLYVKEGARDITGRSFALGDSGGSIYTKRSFEYPVLQMRAQLEDPADTDITDIQSRFVSQGASKGSYIAMDYDSSAEDWTFKARSFRGGGGQGFSLNNMISALGEPTQDYTNAHSYRMVLRRASVDFYYDNGLMGIIQFQEPGNHGESGTGHFWPWNYTVRNESPPYHLAQARSVDNILPWKLEYYGTDTLPSEETGTLFKPNVGTGYPGRTRVLRAWTGGTAWKGTSIDSGSLTSDRVPCLGFQSVVLNFGADTSGTLELKVDWGDDSIEPYDSITTNADEHHQYIFNSPIPWLQLVYTPDSYPATVNHAFVHQKG